MPRWSRDAAGPTLSACYRAVKRSCRDAGAPGQDARLDLPSRAQLRTEQVITPREAFFADTELVKPQQAAGRISAELVTPYPPGIPAVMPGELHTEATVEYLEHVVAAGGFVEGAAEQALDKLRVVARQ